MSTPDKKKKTIQDLLTFGHIYDKVHWIKKNNNWRYLQETFFDKNWGKQLRFQSDINLQKAMEMRGRAQGQSEARHWQPNTEVCAGSGKMVTDK